MSFCLRYPTLGLDLMDQYKIYILKKFALILRLIRIKFGSHRPIYLNSLKKILFDKITLKNALLTKMTLVFVTLFHG